MSWRRIWSCLSVSVTDSRPRRSHWVPKTWLRSSSSVPWTKRKWLLLKEHALLRRPQLCRFNLKRRCLMWSKMRKFHRWLHMYCHLHNDMHLIIVVEANPWEPFGVFSVIGMSFVLCFVSFVFEVLERPATKQHVTHHVCLSLLT